MVPAAALPVWPPTTMGPLGVGTATQPKRAAAVLTAPDSPPAPTVKPPRRPLESMDAPVWPDSPRTAEPTRTAEPAPAPPPRGLPAAPWQVDADAAAPVSPQYGDWARQQRVPGSVYGGAPPGHDPGEVPQGFEPSGSLSGQILGEGAVEEPRRGSRAVIIIMVIMGILVAGGLAAAVAYLSGVLR